MQNIAIVGTNGSIGRAFLGYYLSDDNTDVIYSISRSKNNIEDKKIVNLNLNFSDKENYDKLPSSIPKDSIDRVIIASGILHDGEMQPEKTISSLDIDNFQKVFNVNAFAPALLLKTFFPLIKRNSNALIGILSARVGSISDNRIGGWYAYRASKAALNMIIKTAAIELARKDKTARLIGLHPGTVDTNLSKPFQGGTPKEKIFTPHQSIDYLVNVIDDTSPQDTGKILDWQGKEITP